MFRKYNGLSNKSFSLVVKPKSKRYETVKPQSKSLWKESSWQSNHNQKDMRQFTKYLRDTFWHENFGIN